ncbi:hypothetical protein H010_20666 [Hydrogenophaga taeniospiralis CCUG 15921]|uniref:Uncharacterized protein n=1 Tax=Hydrogenophaga taeniospiralis CCUG 15921 TaxID=1281780 RepID=A0A9X4NW04_9BURK|nr:hypothetical protein [Hydrogenophaga taeniospiralis CCUG 15921]
MGVCASKPSVTESPAAPAFTFPAAPAPTFPAPSPAASPASQLPTPPPLPPLPSDASRTATSLAPRQRLSHRHEAGTPAAEAAAALAQSRRERLAPAEVSVAAYLLARTAAGRTVDDRATVRSLVDGQQAIDAGVGALHLGRGNVRADLQASQSEAYVAVQLQRDATTFLLRSMDFTPPTEAAAAIRRTNINMALLQRCWPADLGQKLREHFPSEAAAEQAKDFLAKVVAARYYGAGNCGEHARVVADARAVVAEPPAMTRIAKSSFMDHAWAEAIGSDARLRNDDVIMDGWMRTVAHLREDSHCGSVANDTRWQFDAVQARWLAEVADHALKGLSRYDALLSLTRGAEDIVRKRLESEDVSQVAYSSVPPNLRGDFLDEARRRTAGWPEQSLFVELAGVVRSMGKPVAAATGLQAAGQVLQAFDQLLNQPNYGTLAPDVPRAVDPGTTEDC